LVGDENTMNKKSKIVLVRTGILSMLCVFGLAWMVQLLSISVDVMFICMSVVLLTVSMILQLWLKERMRWLSLVLETLALLAMIFYTFEMYLPFKYTLFG
jgi:hypothetical protein